MEISNLQELLQRVEEVAEEDGEVFLGEVVEAVGNRSFGPLLLAAGVIIASPVSGMPGVPTSMGFLVLLIAVQLLMNKSRFWFPRWLLNRSASSGKTFRVLRHLRGPARFVDRFLKQRMQIFTYGVATYFVAAACALIAAAMPMMELVPFSVHGAGLALTAFGLGLIARDGLLVLIAFIATACTFGVAALKMLD